VIFFSKSDFCLSIRKDFWLPAFLTISTEMLSFYRQNLRTFHQSYPDFGSTIKEYILPFSSVFFTKMSISRILCRNYQSLWYFLPVIEHIKFYQLEYFSILSLEKKRALLIQSDLFSVIRKMCGKMMIYFQWVVLSRLINICFFSHASGVASMKLQNN
jgi:hypothetical protein